ncbi:uncharacterized protein ACIBXB_021055 [Morphnus guianensis]
MQEQSFTPRSSSSLPAGPAFEGNEGKAKRPKSLPNVPAVVLQTWETADPCLGAEDGNRPSPRGLLSLPQPPPHTPSPTQQGSTELPISSPVQPLLPDEEDGITRASG